MEKFCDFLVVSRTTGRTNVKEFVNHETTELLNHVVSLINGDFPGTTVPFKAKYVHIYQVSYDGELVKILEWWSNETE